MKSEEFIQQKLIFELGEPVFAALKNPSVTEVMLNPDGKLWVDSFEGKKPIGEMPSEVADSLLRTIATICSTTINWNNPEFSGEFTLDVDGDTMRYRFQGCVPPIVESPTFAIRRPASHVFSLDDYVRDGILKPIQKRIIQQMIAEYKNILVIGPANSGKTTFTNAVLHEIAKQFPDSRVITIEDTRELQCAVTNKVHLRQCDDRSINDLVRVSLRLRPDYLLIGECRGPEAHAMIKSMNTGHPGVSTLHADSAQKGLRRLEQLVQEANVPPCPEAIAGAIDVIIIITRAPQKKSRRVISEIASVDSYDCENRRYVTSRLTTSIEN